MKYANGDIYEGKWMLDSRNGKGIMKYANANGAVYEGEWLNN
jgi:hypothetical protein